jgi:hypothetical protein
MGGQSALTFTSGLAIRRMERIVECLQGLHLTARQVGLAIHITQKMAKVYLDHLSTEGDNQRTHLDKWAITESGRMAAHYTAGPGKNAARPPLLTPKQIEKRRRAKWRKDPDKLDYERDRRRTAHYGGKPDPAAAWLNNPIT